MGEREGERDQDSILLYNPGWPGTHSVAHAGLKLMINLPPQPPVLGLQGRASDPGFS